MTSHKDSYTNLKEKEPIRPVRCFICKKRMYYFGQKDHEPEYELHDHSSFKGYIHQRCVKPKGVRK